MKKIIDTPFGKAEVIMEEIIGDDPIVYMTKERYKKLTSKIKYPKIPKKIEREMKKVKRAFNNTVGSK